MNCGTAESLARWVAEIVLPAAKRLLGAAPTTIVHGSTYVCRPRNNVAGEKLSEHAHANAVDIAAIAFADREPVAIGRSEAATAGGEIRGGDPRRRLQLLHHRARPGLQRRACHALPLRHGVAARRLPPLRARRSPDASPARAPEIRSANSRHRRRTSRRASRDRAASGGSSGQSDQRQRVDQIVEAGGQRGDGRVAQSLARLAPVGSAEGEAAVEPPGGEGRRAIETSRAEKGSSPRAVMQQREQAGIDQEARAADQREAEEPRCLARRWRCASLTALRAPARSGRGCASARRASGRALSRISPQPARMKPATNMADAEERVGACGKLALADATSGSISDQPGDPEDQARRPRRRGTAACPSPASRAIFSDAESCRRRRRRAGARSCAARRQVDLGDRDHQLARMHAELRSRCRSRSRWPESSSRSGA